MKILFSILAAAALISIPMAANAAETCRDAKGKFIKCPEKPKPAPQKCKDAKGKFAKCGTPGAKPI